MYEALLSVPSFNISTQNKESNINHNHTNSKQRDWNKHFKRLKLNTFVNKTTNQSPFELLYENKNMTKVH